MFFFVGEGQGVAKMSSDFYVGIIRNLLILVRTYLFLKKRYTQK